MSITVAPTAFCALLRRQISLAPRSSCSYRSSSSSSSSSFGHFHHTLNKGAQQQQFRLQAQRCRVSGSSCVSASSSLIITSDSSSSSSSFLGQQRHKGSGPHLHRKQRQQHQQHQHTHRSSTRAHAFTTTAAAPNDNNNNMGGASHDARVVTYNVLSSSLCEPEYFTHCAPEDLDPPARLAKLKAKLEPEMAKGAVIGLQEVSQKWAGDLHVFFAQRGYHLVCSLYGKPFNGYMGIALAVPLDKYEVCKVDISRCSDTARLPKEPTPGGGILRKFFVDVPKDLFHKVTGKRPEQSDWRLARGRFNTIMYAALKCKSTGVEFGVANYHMPCMFRNPKVMTIHSQLAGMYAQRMAGDLPAVLMGDFNLKPGDGGYDLITSGTLAEGLESSPEVPEGGGMWTTSLGYPMRSAYKVANGAEPDFTNYARIKDDPEFIDTLDYIFISPTVEVAEVTPLPHRSEVKGPFPSPLEPSDHILLAATIRIPRTSK